MNRVVTRAMGLGGAVLLGLMLPAMAGSNYEAGPTTGDNGVLAGVLLLALIGVALLANGGIKPPPPPDDKEADEE